MNRSSKHNIESLNYNKNIILEDFCKEYKRAVKICVNFIWNNEIKFTIKNKEYIFDISKDLLNNPKYIDYKIIPYSGKLSARAMSEASRQALGIISSVIDKKKKLIYVRNKYITENKDIFYLNKKIEKTKYSMPKCDNIPVNLSNRCVDFSFDSKHFDCFIRIYCTGFDHIKIPIKFTENFSKRKLKNWKLCSGISIHNNYIQLNQEIESLPIKKDGQIIGVDTGIKHVYSLSNNIQSKEDIHGHTLDKILKKISKKKNTSKARRKVEEHRKNYINWTINQIDLSEIKQLNIENVQLFNGAKKNKYLSGFTHALILNKIRMVAEEQQVAVVLRLSPYKSQRCSSCGFVKKSNRNNEIYTCSCGSVMNADINSAINNSIDLPYIEKWVSTNKLNITGFYWLEGGIFDLNGEELRVPCIPKNIITQ